MEVVRTSFLESRESEFGDFGLRKQYIDFGIENIARKCRDFDISIAPNKLRMTVNQMGFRIDE